MRDNENSDDPTWSSFKPANGRKNNLYHQKSQPKKKSPYKKIEIISPMFGKRSSHPKHTYDTTTRSNHVFANKQKIIQENNRSTSKIASGKNRYEDFANTSEINGAEIVFDTDEYTTNYDKLIGNDNCESTCNEKNVTNEDELINSKTNDEYESDDYDEFKINEPNNKKKTLFD